MKTALLLFIICTFANVVLSTIKSVMTIKGGKVSAAIWNALAFGLYSYIVVLTATAPISTLGKVLVTVGCNLIGVYGVKLFEEKLRKDRLWKVEMTVKNDAYGMTAAAMHGALSEANIPNNYVEAGNYAIFNCYCATKTDTENAVTIGADYGAKYFASETTFTP
jgi:hypothetical protein